MQMTETATLSSCIALQNITRQIEYIGYLITSLCKSLQAFVLFTKFFE